MTWCSNHYKTLDRYREAIGKSRYNTIIILRLCLNLSFYEDNLFIFFLI